MNEVSLGELIAPARTVRAGSRDLPILSMTMRHGLVDQGDKFKKDVASRDRSQYKIVTREQLVVGFPIDEGVLAFQDLYEEAIVSPAYGVWDVVASSAHLPYLEKFLRSPRAIAFYKARLRGTTARRRSLPNSVFLELAVPLPPLPEQRRIAAILDHADALRVKRREAIARLDELARSVFVDMFGDPERAAPEMVPLGAVSAISSGSTPKRSNGALYGGTTPWVKTGEVNNEVIESTEEHLTDEGVRHARLKIYPPGSILVAMYGQGATRGRVGLLGVRATTNQACAVIEPNDRILPEFMFDQLKFSYQRLRGEGRGGNQPNLNGKLVASFPVYVPDLQMQLDYCRKRASLDRSRSSMKAQLAATDSLCSSLQSRAFRGEL